MSTVFMNSDKCLKIIIIVIFSFSFLVFNFPASAQKVLQCAPGTATVNSNLQVGTNINPGDLTVSRDTTVKNNLSVEGHTFAAQGAQRIFLGNNTSSPYITNNAGNGILFYSQGGQNFLWQSLTNTNPDAMILRSGGGLPNDNGYNLQVFGQMSSYQVHAQGIHIDMQGGIGPVPRPNILKFTNSAATGTGAAIFLGDSGAWDDNDLIFAQYTGTNDIGQIGIAMDAPSGNVGIKTVNPQITLAIGDNDTGLKWISDGNFQLVSNGTQELTIDPGNVRVRNNLCLGGVCASSWPANPTITLTGDVTGSGTTNIATTIPSGAVDWSELSGIPAGFSDGADNGLTAVAWGDVSAKPAICPIGQFVTDISAGTCAAPGAIAEADTLDSVTGRGNTTTNAIIVGGLTADTNTLYVDSVNNRVGIGTLAPSYELDMGAANGRIHLSNPLAALNAYITAGASETSTTKANSVAIKDSLWVTQNAFIDGTITIEGTYTVDGGVPGTFIDTTERYIVEAGPASVGIVRPIDYATMSRLCRDVDGCEMTIAMINWDSVNWAGNVATRNGKFFMSQTSTAWRFSQYDPSDPQGGDNSGIIAEWNDWDCYVTDAETYTGAPNGRTDSAFGFGLLNAQGGGYSDTTTICRIIIED